jgi:hypothetical protein
VRAKFEAEALREGRHLRRRHHVAARAHQHHHVRVVDHAPLAGSLEVRQRIRQKYLALEAREARVVLVKTHPRVAKHQCRRLHCCSTTCHHRVVRRRVVLHFLAGAEVVVADGGRRRVPDAVAPAEGRQRRIRQLDSALGELLVDAHQVTVRGSVQLQNLRSVGLCALRSLEARHLRRPASKHALHASTRDTEHVGDRARPVAFLTQAKDGRSCRLIQHDSPALLAPTSLGRSA